MNEVFSRIDNMELSVDDGKLGMSIVCTSLTLDFDGNNLIGITSAEPQTVKCEVDIPHA